MKFPYTKVVLSIVFSLICLFTTAQNWDWYHKSYDTISQSSFMISHHDTQNNYYVFGHYYDTILFPDTAFIHSNNVHGDFKAVARYNANGIFQDAFDIYSEPNNLISNTVMTTTSKNEHIVIGGFREVVYCNGFEINHGETPYPYLPEIFVAKMDKDYHIIWADIIGGTFQDDVLDIAVSKSDLIYIATNHKGDLNNESMNYFLSQDTTFHYADFVAITCINDDKEIVWKQEIVGDLNGNMTIGEDENIHFFGACWTNIIIGEDTIFNPIEVPHPSESYYSFVISFSLQGELLEAQFIDKDVLFLEGFFNQNGDIYTYARIRDTVVFEGDTLFGDPNLIIAKLNSQRDVEWYKYFHAIDGKFSFVHLPMQVKNDHVYFSAASNTDFYIDETLISSSFPVKTIYGEFNNEGGLVWNLLLQSDLRVVTGGLILDNCSNIVFNGSFKNCVYFPEDTICTNTIDYGDDFFAKIALSDPVINFLGPDTTACDSILISTPGEYINYIWNDSITTQNEILIRETGEVFLAVGDEENCWQYDTIQIQIDEGFKFDLGSDTSIFGNDTIYLSVIDELEEYLWSDSSLINQIEIVGNNYGIGEFAIWLQASRGVCSFSDTLLLTIEQGFGLEDIENDALNLYPNPSSHTLVVEIIEDDWMNLSYSIFNMNGKKQKEGKVLNKSQIIHIEDLEAGLYLLVISDPSKKKTILSKFIKE